MKSWVDRVFRKAQAPVPVSAPVAAAVAASAKPRLSLPVDLAAVLPAVDGAVTPQKLAKLVAQAQADGAALSDLQPVLACVLDHDALPDDAKVAFAAAFCQLPHSPQDLRGTLTAIDTSGPSHLATGLLHLLDQLDSAPEALPQIAGIALSAKGGFRSQKASLRLLAQHVTEATAPDLPIARLRDTVLATLALPSSSPRNKSVLSRALCRLPHPLAEVMPTIRALETVEDLTFEDHLLHLVAGLVITPDQDIDQLVALATYPGVDGVSLGRLIVGMLDAGLAVPDAVVATVRDGRPLSIVGYTRLLHWLRLEHRLAEAEAILQHARGTFPEAGAFIFLELAQTSDGDSVVDMEAVIGNITHNRTFYKHLNALYGPQAALVPAFKRDTHDILFADPPDGPDAAAREQADTLAGTAALLVTQMMRLAVLRFGEPRETTALHGWGSAHYAAWLQRSTKVANTARLLLDTAIDLAPDSALALKTSAQLLSLFARHDEAAAAWEAYLALPAATKAEMPAYLKALCQTGRQDEAAPLASALGGEATSYRAAHYAPMADFSAHQASTPQLEADPGEIPFRAVRGTEVKRFSQPVTFEPVALHQLRDVTLVGTQLIGPDQDALAFDNRFEIVTLPAGKQPTSPGQAVCGVTGLIYDDAAPHETISDPVALLPGLPSMYQNYYHAVIQNLGRLPWLMEKGLLDERQLILPETIPNWARQIVLDLGVSEDQIRLASPDRIYHVTDALTPTPARMIGAPHPDLLARLRAHLGVSDHPAPADGRRIFWSRKSAENTRRALTNEPQLRQMAEDRGFEVLDPVGLSIHDQVALLADTSVIAGATGGAFANQVFGPPGLRVICTAPRQSAKNYYPLLAGVCGQDFIWVLGEFLREGYHGLGYPQLPYHVNPDSFAAALDALDQDL